MCTRRWLVTGAILVLPALLSVCGFTTCSDAERAVLAEFPQYGGAQPVVEANQDTGACAVYYQAPDPPPQTHTYFVEQLTAHGWTVDPQSDGWTLGTGGTLLTAQRDNVVYTIYYESLEMYTPPQGGTHLAVHVSER